MVYLAVMIVSAAGIAALFLMRGILRSRNARRIVRYVRQGFSSVEQRNVKLIPDSPIERTHKSPRARAIEMQQARTHLKDAERSIAKRDVKAAERSLIRALTLQPESTDVKVQLARVYLETCREPKAEALYRDLLSAHTNPALFANLGLALYKQEKFAESHKAYQKAYDLDPENPDRATDLGRVSIAAEKFTEATEYLEKALKSHQQNLRLLHLLAQCYLHIGDEEGACETYRRINRLDPRDEEVKARLAEMVQPA